MLFKNELNIQLLETPLRSEPVLNKSILSGLQADKTNPAEQNCRQCYILVLTRYVLCYLTTTEQQKKIMNNLKNSDFLQFQELTTLKNVSKK